MKLKTVFTASLCAAFLAFAFPAQAEEKPRAPRLENPDSWSVVVIPDPQGYMKRGTNQPILELMTAWIAQNAERLNIRMVLCTGDMVEQNDRICNGYSGDQSSAMQWQASARAFGRLDGIVPYLTATGNHDYTYTHSGEKRTHLDEYFPIDKNPLNRKTIRQYGLDQQGNHTQANTAYEITAPDGTPYLFLNMEFAPRDTVVAWARRITSLEEYSGHRIVLLTHAYLNTENNRTHGMTKVTCYEPVVVNGRITKYKQELPDANNGEQIWNKLVKPAGNIELVICGHISGRGFRTDRNDAGRDVHQMLFDAQSMGGGYEGNGGDGWLRLLEFDPDGITVRVKTFSPLFWLSPASRSQAWMSDAGNEFAFRFSERKKR